MRTFRWSIFPLLLSLLVGPHSVFAYSVTSGRIVDAQGLYVLLDHHRPDCQSISELWYTAQYSEQHWIADLTFLAQRYGARPHVIEVAAAVGRAAPHWRIFVAGIQENPSCSVNNHPFWGENLEPLSSTALSIPADRLVLSTHTYGPDVFGQPYFNTGTAPKALAVDLQRAHVLPPHLA